MVNSNANYSCHDEETELLTKRGWLKYNEIKETDESATIECGELVYQNIDHVHVYDYTGKMREPVIQRADVEARKQEPANEYERAIDF